MNIAFRTWHCVALSGIGQSARVPPIYYAELAPATVLPGGVSGARAVRMEGFGKADSEALPFLVFNEFVAGRIAAAVGVPVPPGAPAILDPGHEKIWISLSFSKPGAGPPPPTTGKAVFSASERMACKILAFDVLIGNGDRHEGNVSVASKRIDLWDHDRAILSHGRPNLLSSPDAMAYLDCYQSDFIVDGITDRLSQPHLLLDSVSDDGELLDATKEIQRRCTNEVLAEAVDDACRLELSGVSPAIAERVGEFLRFRRDNLQKLFVDHREALTSCFGWSLLWELSEGGN